MTPYLLSKKFIGRKFYNEADITKRVNTFYMFGQLDQEEYEELIILIEKHYTEPVV